MRDLFTATDKRTLRHFMHVTLRFRREFLLSLLNPVGAILMYSVLTYYIGKTLAALATGSGDPRAYIPALLVVALLGALCNWIGFRSMIRLQARVMGFLQSEALDTLLKRGIGFHNNNLSGKLVSDASDYPGAYSMLNAAVLMNIIPFVSIIISGVLIIFINSWVLGLVVTVMSATAIGTSLIESRRRSGLRVERLKAQKRVIGHIADTITNAQTVKAFANESTEMGTHTGYNETLLAHRLNDWSKVASNGSRRLAVLLLFQIGLILVGIELVTRDPSLLAASIFAFTYSITLVNRLFTINEMVRAIEDGLLQASPMTDIIDETIEISDKPDAPDLHVTGGRVALDNVTFRYEDAKHNDHVFENLSFTIEPNQKVGLVGPSGSGKSTLTRLLLRFDDIQSGSIQIDGQNIADIAQSSLRRSIAYVPQEPLLFHRSIIDNIAYGNPTADLNDIRRAADQAHASEFIAQLPEGMDTIVGERGVKLSGGQRQRIAIARAILKDAPILILDEATSALDSESEHLIQQALATLMENRTVLVIAHRLSTIAHMDRVLVMEDGRVTQDGPHNSLVHQTGTYKKLWQRQSGGFIEE